MEISSYKPYGKLINSTIRDVNLPLSRRVVWVWPAPLFHRRRGGGRGCEDCPMEGQEGFHRDTAKRLSPTLYLWRITPAGRGRRVGGRNVSPPLSWHVSQNGISLAGHPRRRYALPPAPFPGGVCGDGPGGCIRGLKLKGGSKWPEKTVPLPDTVS